MKTGNEARLSLGMMANGWVQEVLVSRGTCWTQLEKVDGAPSVFSLAPSAMLLGLARREDLTAHLLPGFPARASMDTGRSRMSMGSRGTD